MWLESILILTPKSSNFWQWGENSPFNRWGVRLKESQDKINNYQVQSQLTGLNHLPQPNHPKSVTVAKILTSRTYINDTPLGRNTVPRHTGHFIMFSMITNTYSKKTRGPTLKELFTATGKLKKFFLTTTDVQCVHHGWHGTHRYDIQVLAPHASTWVHLGMDHCSSEEYRCTHVDACVARTWILYRCVLCHQWCTHWTSVVSEIYRS
jgi:hypothetical protein